MTVLPVYQGVKLGVRDLRWVEGKPDALRSQAGCRSWCELLLQEEPAVARRVIVDAAENRVAEAFIEAASLEAERIEPNTHAASW
jgi:hypothetical protein